MDRLRILINASPRSGHAWLQYLLFNSLKNSDGVNLGDATNNFIIRSNSPVILNGRFDDILQVTILRNPMEIIPSIVTKTMGGLGNTVTSGIAMPHEMLEPPSLRNLVYDQFTIYSLWVENIVNNLDKVMPFTFEQVTQDTEFVMDSIMDNFDVDYNLVLNKNIPLSIEDAKIKISQHNKGEIGFNNPVPVDRKPDVYYRLKEIVENHKRLDATVRLYNDSCKLIKDAQSKWKIN